MDSKLEKSVHSVGGCPRCVLRFAGVREPSQYNALGDKLDPEGCQSETGPSNEGVCPFCLGLLQNGGITRQGDPSRITPAQLCIEEVVKLGYQVRDFSIGLRLPVCILVLEQAFVLTQPEGASTGITPVPVKDVLRWLLSEEVGKALGLACVKESELTITLSASNRGGLLF
ncbi:unnamed protein product [Chrysoparadoxa australica]